MPKIGLFFGSSTGNSENVARMIAQSFKPHHIDIHDVIHDKSHIINNYSSLIFGIPSWNKHYQQDDWYYFLPKITTANFSGKKVALYGLGDQINYSDNFVDSMGRMYDWLTERKATVVGQWPVVGYRFRKSKAVRNGKFVGLVLDEDTQYQLTLPRIKMWVENLKNEFEIKS
jgi:flavodoxin I